MSDHTSEELTASKNLEVDQHQLSAGDRRRAALSEIDEAKFGWVHIKACLVAGVGFFTDA